MSGRTGEETSLGDVNLPVHPSTWRVLWRVKNVNDVSRAKIKFALFHDEIPM